MLELLAPAGNEEALRAAVQNGADAVYAGGKAFGARAQAAVFFGDTLRQSVAYCHAHGVKFYMTVNTLMKDPELEDAYTLVKEAVDAGVDAYLVQDLGLAQLLKSCFSGIQLHASTQMSLCDAQGALFAQQMGLTRVVAARECSLETLRAMAQTGVQIEAFAHGALCMGFSGQCLLSSMIGGRSGNRGRCAQPCRLPYTLDGKKGYALSTADLCTLNNMKDYLDAGIAAVKLEGRLKRPEYVAVVTGAYRRAIDLALEGRLPQPQAKEELLSIFHRGGFTQGYAFSHTDGAVLAQQRPNHQGVLVGKVLSAQNGRAHVELTQTLNKGDGLEARMQGMEGIGIVVDDPQAATLRVPTGVKAGMELYRTTNAAQLEQARQTYEKDTRKTSINGTFTLHAGMPASLAAQGITVMGALPQAATGKPLTVEAVRLQLEKLGDTPFCWDTLDIDLDEGLYLPVSALNALRRELLDKVLDARLANTKPQVEVKPYALPYTNTAFVPAQPPLLIHQSAELAQLLVSEADELYWQPERLEQDYLRDGLQKLADRTAYLVLPPNASAADKAMAADLLKEQGGVGLVATNLSQLEECAAFPIVAGWSLNALNTQTAARLKQLGAKRVTASLECNLSMALRIAQSCPTELVLYGQLPLMYLAACPLRAQHGLTEQGREQCALCGGKGYTLTDRKGEVFPILPIHTAKGCLLQVCNPHTLLVADQLDAAARQAFAALRVIGTAQDVRNVKAALQGDKTAFAKDSTAYTRGHLFRGVE